VKVQETVSDEARGDQWGVGWYGLSVLQELLTVRPSHLTWTIESDCSLLSSVPVIAIYYYLGQADTYFTKANSAFDPSGVGK